MFNAAILSATSLILQLGGIAFNLYISSKAGASGMGLYQLIMSVYRISVTLSLSGIGLTATRMVSEELAQGNGVSAAVNRCLAYSVFFGTLVALLLFLFGGFIGSCLIKDVRSIAPIRIMGIGMPFTAMSCVLSGYFTAVERVGRSAIAQILEFAARMAFTVTLCNYAPSAMLSATVFSGATAEIVSFFLLYLFYIWDSGKYKNRPSPTGGLTKKMLRIALPVGTGSYLRSGLVSAEQIAIPAMLMKYGGSHDAALAKYGIIQGTVMPVIMFPSAFLAAFSELIIPTLSACRIKNRQERITRIVSEVFGITLIFSVCISGIMFNLSDVIALTVLKNPQSGIFIRLLAPLATAMYLDNAVDGMLKGLDCQVSSMKYNIIDSAVSIFLVLTLIPKTGINGYIGVIFAGELLNSLLSASKLVRISDLRISLRRHFIKPVFAAVVANISLYAFFTPLPGYLNLTIYSLYISAVYLKICIRRSNPLTFISKYGKI